MVSTQNKISVWSNNVISTVDLKNNSLRMILKKKKKDSFYLDKVLLSEKKAINQIKTPNQPEDRKRKRTNSTNIPYGSVVFLLGKKYKGKKAILLKATQSGLLVISGPYNLSGVPLRRVNSCYIKPTGAAIELKGLNLSKLDDSYFNSLIQTKKLKQEGICHYQNLSHKLRQCRLDKKLNQLIKDDPFLSSYIRSREI